MTTSGSPARTVLVVEDDAMIRMVLAEELADAGFAVLEAKNAEAAIALIVAHPGLWGVVTDVSMPGPMDGLGLARWMRVAAPRVLIVIASALPDLPDASEINPAIIRMVSKPYQFHAVIDCFRDLGIVPAN